MGSDSSLAFQRSCDDMAGCGKESDRCFPTNTPGSPNLDCRNHNMGAFMWPTGILLSARTGVSRLMSRDDVMNLTRASLVKATCHFLGPSYPSCFWVSECLCGSQQQHSFASHRRSCKTSAARGKWMPMAASVYILVTQGSFYLSNSSTWLMFSQGQ